MLISWSDDFHIFAIIIINHFIKLIIEIKNLIVVSVYKMHSRGCKFEHFIDKKKDLGCCTLYGH